MANLMNQLSSMFKNLLEPADDPRQTFANPWQRQQELLHRVRDALLQNTSLRKRLEQRIVGVQGKIPQLQETAKQAVIAGRDDMARMALQQRQLALMELQTLEANAKEVWLEEQRISIVEQRLTAQIDAMRVRQEMTAARYTAAESQVMVHEALNGFSKELADMGLTIEHTEQKTERLQAQANAFEEMMDISSLEISSGASDDPVARQLMQLDLESAVNDQLADLKQKLQN